MNPNDITANRRLISRGATVPASARIRVAALGLLTALGLVGCGSGAAHHEAQPTATTHRTTSMRPAFVMPNPHAVVARVGSNALTAGTLAHLVAVQIGMEPASVRVHLVPPQFSECIAYLKNKAQQESITATTDAIKRKCEEHYEADRQETVKRWISGEWVIHGAEEAGVPTTPKLIRERYTQGVREGFKTYADFEKYLSESDQTEADQLRQVRVVLAGERIREKIQKEANDIPPTVVYAYYRSHISDYTIPRRRDLNILRLKTRAEATKALHEIAAGRSFASLAKASTLPQPIFSKNGLVRGLGSGVYHEHALNQAIFGAKFGVLGGPVKINLGWYVFEVKAAHPGRIKSLAEVKTSIRQMLPELRREKLLAAFTSRWRAKWRLKTDCSPGYVMRKCKQFKLTPGLLPEDPYTFT